MQLDLAGARSRVNTLGMATKVYETPRLFTRIISKGRPTSWAVGLPFAIVIVVLIAAFAYSASRATTYSEQLGAAQHDLATQQQNLDSAQKRLTTDEMDLAIAKSPGVATVNLQPAAKPAADSDTPAVQPAWASATWGEVGGRTFVLLRAYGLTTPPQGKAYQAWFEGADPKPVLLGALDPGPAGSAFVMGKELPAMATAKRVFVTLGAEDGKVVPAGAPLMEAKLVAPQTADKAPPAADKQ